MWKKMSKWDAIFISINKLLIWTSMWLWCGWEMSIRCVGWLSITWDLPIYGKLCLNFVRNFKDSYISLTKNNCPMFSLYMNDILISLIGMLHFVSGLPRGKKGNDWIWVIMDYLTKSALFLPIRMMDSVDRLAKLYVNEVIRLYGVLISIVSDRDLRFT